MFFYAMANYHIGTLTNMGPGFFPVSLGILLAVIGALICAYAWFANDQSGNFKLRTMILVTASAMVFGAALNTLGLVAATMLAVAISSLADRETTWRSRCFLTLATAAIVWLIFIFGFGMALSVWPWSV